MDLDHGRSAMGLVSWLWLLGARSECKPRREIQQHILRVGLVFDCCGLTLISTCPSPNFQSFLHNQHHQGKKERSLPTSNLSPEFKKKKKFYRKYLPQVSYILLDFFPNHYHPSMSSPTKITQSELDELHFFSVTRIHPYV